MGQSLRVSVVTLLSLFEAQQVIVSKTPLMVFAQTDAVLQPEQCGQLAHWEVGTRDSETRLARACKPLLESSQPQLWVSVRESEKSALSCP